MSFGPNARRAKAKGTSSSPAAIAAIPLAAALSCGPSGAELMDDITTNNVKIECS
jgi:hypothetical protein